MVQDTSFNPEANAARELQPMTGPLISVGIPTYNRAKSLERTLECICNQTYSNLEILVSDNCSSDPEVRRVVERRSQIDSRIKATFSNENHGAGFNFRKVLALSTGQYFMWASDDDYWKANFIERLYTLFKNDRDAVIAFCDMDARNFDGTISNNYKPFYETFTAYDSRMAFRRVRSYALQNPFLGKANLVYGLHRRSTLLASFKRYFDSTAWGSDMLLTCDILSKGALVLTREKMFSKFITIQETPQDTPTPRLNAHKEKHTYALARLKHNAYLALIIFSCKKLNAMEKIFLFRDILVQAVSWLRTDLN